MPKTPKEKGKPLDSDHRDPSNWGDDQRTRGYYYDDAHGYEKYEPEKDNEIETDNRIDNLDRDAG